MLKIVQPAQMYTQAIFKATIVTILQLSLLQDVHNSLDGVGIGVGVGVGIVTHRSSLLFVTR